MITGKGQNFLTMLKSMGAVLCLLIGLSCAMIRPYKYDLTPLQDIERFYIYPKTKECVKQTIRTDEKGIFQGFDEEEVKYKKCLSDLLVCYPPESEAQLETFIHSIFREYIEF